MLLRGTFASLAIAFLVLMVMVAAWALYPPPMREIALRFDAETGLLTLHREMTGGDAVMEWTHEIHIPETGRVCSDDGRNTYESDRTDSVFRPGGDLMDCMFHVDGVHVLTWSPRKFGFIPMRPIRQTFTFEDVVTPAAGEPKCRRIRVSSNGLYHEPGTRFYESVTTAGVCFNTPEEAEAQGYRRAGE